MVLMARRPERNFFEQFKRNVAKTGYLQHVQRVENVACVGHPDVNYCFVGVEGNLEFKAFERVRLTGRFTVPKLRLEQTAWLTARGNVGGRAYLLSRINQDVVLIDGRLTPALFDKTLHLDWVDGEKIATVWLRPPIDWARLVRTLIDVPVNDRTITERLGLFRVRKLTA